MENPPSKLEKISQDELDELARNHDRFLKGIRGGGRAVFKFKDLSGLDFSGTDFSQSDFTGSNLTGANMAGGTFRGVSFFACDMRDANLESADCSRADFRGAYVAGANLTGANLAGADLREGKIMEKGAKGILQDRPDKGRKQGSKTWHKAVFTGAKMTDTNLSGSRAGRADFTDADLKGVVVKDADLSGVKF